MATDLSKLSKEEKEKLCRTCMGVVLKLIRYRYLLGRFCMFCLSVLDFLAGLVFLPFMWLANVLWFFKLAFCGSEINKNIRRSKQQ